MAEEVSCVYCGDLNPADALFCQACSRVLEDPQTLEDQHREIYLDREQVLITEDSAYLYGKTYPISEIQELEIIEKTKAGRNWGVGLMVFGGGTIINGLFGGDIVFSLVCGGPCLLAGALLALLTKPTAEKMVSTLWITTKDGEEHSRAFDDQAEAQAIREAIQRACVDQGVKLEAEST